MHGLFYDLPLNMNVYIKSCEQCVIMTVTETMLNLKRNDGGMNIFLGFWVFTIHLEVTKGAGCN